MIVYDGTTEEYVRTAGNDPPGKELLIDAGKCPGNEQKSYIRQNSCEEVGHVMSTISPGVTLCGWLGSTHQLTNKI